LVIFNRFQQTYTRDRNATTSSFQECWLPGQIGSQLCSTSQTYRLAAPHPDQEVLGTVHPTPPFINPRQVLAFGVVVRPGKELLVMDPLQEKLGMGRYIIGLVTSKGKEYDQVGGGYGSLFFVHWTRPCLFVGHIISRSSQPGHEPWQKVLLVLVCHTMHGLFHDNRSV